MSTQLEHLDMLGNVLSLVDILEVHKKGLLHRSVNVLIADSYGFVYCSRLKHDNIAYPGFWTTSTLAHVLPNQTPEDAALSSLKEQLGISCELKPLGNITARSKYDNEISITYLGVCDKNIFPNKKALRSGEFMKTEAIHDLTLLDRATPHLGRSIDLYIQKMD
jgi:isopentenyl-diphosphate delta-isomerase